MATKKKVVQKQPLTIKQRIKNEIAHLAKLGYTVEDLDSSETTAIGKSKRNLFIHLTNDQLPFCCGVSEYGELSLSEKLTKAETPAMKSLIKLKLLQIKDESIVNVKTKIPTAFGVVFCSNGLHGWKLTEQVLETELFDEYALVSTTRNGTGGNVIKMYVAKY